MDKLKRDPSYSIDAIRPVTHVCKVRAARACARTRARPHRSNGQSEKNDQGHLQNYRPMRN